MYRLLGKSECRSRDARFCVSSSFLALYHSLSKIEKQPVVGGRYYHYVVLKQMGIGFELRYSIFLVRYSIFALLNFDILFTLINGMLVIAASLSNRVAYGYLYEKFINKYNRCGPFLHRLRRRMCRCFLCRPVFAWKGVPSRNGRGIFKIGTASAVKTNRCVQ